MRWPWQSRQSPSKLGKGLDPGLDPDLDHVYPHLKTPGFVIATNGLPTDQRPLTTVFVGELLVAYGIDRDDHIRYLPRAGYEDETGRARVDAVAKSNLFRLIQQPGHLQLDQHGNLTRVTIPENLTASLLLLDDFWKEGLGRIGPISAVVPSRDELWFGPSSQVDALAGIVAARDFNHRHALVPHILGFDSGGWQAYKIG